MNSALRNRPHATPDGGARNRSRRPRITMFGLVVLLAVAGCGSGAGTVEAPPPTGTAPAGVTFPSPAVSPLRRLVGQSYTWAGVVDVSVIAVRRSADTTGDHAAYLVDVRVTNPNPRGFNTGALTVGLAVGPRLSAATFDPAAPASTGQDAVVPGGASIDAVYAFRLPLAQSAADVTVSVRPSPVAQLCLFTGAATS